VAEQYASKEFLGETKREILDSIRDLGRRIDQHSWPLRGPMGNTITEFQAYAQDVATFSQAVETGFQAISTTFAALLANFQTLLSQVQASMSAAAVGAAPTSSATPPAAEPRASAWLRLNNLRDLARRIEHP
jgi:hypothetical protein